MCDGEMAQRGESTEWSVLVWHISRGQETKSANGNDTHGETCNQPFTELISFSSFFVAGFDKLAKKYILHTQERETSYLSATFLHWCPPSLLVHPFQNMIQSA